MGRCVAHAGILLNSRYVRLLGSLLFAPSPNRLSKHRRRLRGAELLPHVVWCCYCTSNPCWILWAKLDHVGNRLYEGMWVQRGASKIRLGSLEGSLCLSTCNRLKILFDIEAHTVGVQHSLTHPNHRRGNGNLIRCLWNSVHVPCPDDPVS